MNNLTLTDNELSVIITSLQMSLMSYERFIAENGENRLDIATKNTINEMKELFNRLENI
jgi:hypothetical protein